MSCVDSQGNLSSGWPKSPLMQDQNQSVADPTSVGATEAKDAVPRRAACPQVAHPLPACSDGQASTPENTKSGSPHYPLHEEAGPSLRETYNKIAGSKEKIGEVIGLMSDLSEFFDKVKSFAGVDADVTLMDGLTSRLESLLIFAMQVAEAETLQSLLLASLAYAKTLVKGSLLKRLTTVVTALLTQGVDKNGNVYDKKKIKNPMRNESNTDFKSCWKQHVKGEFGKRVSSLLNIFVCIGFMPEKADTFLQKEFYNLFDVKTRAVESVSIFDHVANVVDYCINNVYPFVTTGEYHYLLSSTETRDIDAQYRKIVKIVDLHLTGQTHVLRDEHEVTDVAQIIVKIHDVYANTLTMLNKVDGGLKRELNTRLMKLDKMATDLSAGFHESASRVAPYAVLIRGGSSQAKTTLTQIGAHVMSKANGWPEGEQFIVTLNGSDKFQSELLPQHIIVIFDDIANTKPEFADGNPLFVLIQFINNVHCSALSAIAERKGKNEIRAKGVFATTNTEDLHAGIFSVNAASIMRRFKLIVDARIKESCKDADGNILPEYASQSIPDIWELTLRTPHIKRLGNLSDRLYYKIRDGDGKQIMQEWKSDVVDFVDYLTEVTPKYFAVQEEYVASSTRMHEQEHCPKHPMYTIPCSKCGRCMRSEAGNEDVQVQFCTDGVPWLSSPTPAAVPQRWFDTDEEEYVDPLADPNLPEWAQGMFDETQEVMEALEAIPEDVPEWAREPEPPKKERRFKPFKFIKKRLGIKTRKEKQDDLAAQAVWSDDIPTTPPPPVERLRYYVRQKILPLQKLRKKFEAIDAKYKVLGILAAGLVFIASQRKRQLKYQGAVNSTFLQRVNVLAQTPKMITDHKDFFKKTFVESRQLPPSSVGATPATLEMRINRHLKGAFIKQVVDGVVQPEETFVNAHPIGGGKWVFPKHCMDVDKVYDVWLLTKPKSIVGVPHIHVKVDASNMYPVPGKDVLIVHLQVGNNWNAAQYYPLKQVLPAVGDELVLYHRAKATMRDENRILEEPSGSKTLVKVKEVKVEDVNGVPQLLVLYDHPVKTFLGLCGAIAVTNTSSPMLIGVHTAGDGTTGGITLISQNDLEEASYPGKVKPIMIAEDSRFPDVVQGKEVKLSPDLHGRSPLNWLEKDQVHSVTYMGSVEGSENSKFKTEIKKSCIADNLKEHMNIEKNHAGPDRTAESKARHKNLHAMAKDKEPMDPTTLKFAQDDLMMKLEEFMETSIFKNFVHVITKEDALNGVPGVPGYDPINTNSSVGWPVNKKTFKMLLQSRLSEVMNIDTKKYMRLVDRPDGVKELRFDVVFDEEKYDIDAMMEEVLKASEGKMRVNIVFKSNLKDEALILQKVKDGKIRVFAGAPKYLVVLCRMLCLSFLVAKKEVPTVFECAVGANALGQDWEPLVEFATKFGKDRLCLGDFKEYDQTNQSILSFSSMAIIRAVLEKAGYSEDLLGAFDLLATEICLPTYVVNGVLVQIFGSVPSGHPLTVELNSINNQLLMRYVYYANYRELFPKECFDPMLRKIPLFHLVIALITYGDDNVMSVSIVEPYFNQLTIVKQLGKIGMIYTAADKTEITKPFCSIEDFSFLKRTYNWHEKMQRYTGALDVESIHKSLTCTRKNKDGPTEASIMAGNMTNALYESFLHSADMHLQYWNGFELVKECHDNQGNSVAAAYDSMKHEFTLEKCIERFESATTRYYDNIEVMGVPKAMGFRYEADVEMIEEEVEIEIDDAITQAALTLVHRLYLDDHTAVEEMFLELEEIENEEMAWRIWRDYHRHALSYELEEAWNNRQRQRRQVRRNARMIEHLVSCIDAGITPTLNLHYNRLLGSYEGLITQNAYNILSYYRTYEKLLVHTKIPTDIIENLAQASKERFYYRVTLGSIAQYSVIGNRGYPARDVRWIYGDDVHIEWDDEVD